MKIDVNLPSERRVIEFELKGNWFHRFVAPEDHLGIALETVHAVCVLSQAQANIVLEGHVETVVKTGCSRCLEEAEIPVKTDFRYILTPATKDDLPGELELSEDDLDVVCYTDESVELDPLIFEQIVLHIPMKALCKDDCRGLCPGCGANLNVNICGCKEGGLHAGFAALRDLKIKKS